MMRSNVQSHSQRIQELNQKIEDQQLIIDKQIVTLGDYLCSLKAGRFQGSPLVEPYRRLKDLKAGLPKNQQTVREILRLGERDQELKSMQKKMRLQQSNVERENAVLCEEIGRSAYAAYRKLAKPDKRYAPIFSRVRKLDQDLQRLDAELKDLEQIPQKETIFQKIAIRGRLIYLKGIRRGTHKDQLRSYSQAGKELCESNLSEAIADDRLRSILEPYRKNKALMQKLEEDAQQFGQEQEQLWQRLKALGAEKNQQKRVSELKREIETLHSQVEDHCHELGQGYLSQPLESLKDEAELKNIAGRIARAKREVAGYTKQIRRLEAAAKAEALNERIQALEEQRVKMEEELSTLKQERDRFMRIRGSERTLLPDKQEASLSENQERPGGGQKATADKGEDD